MSKIILDFGSGNTCRNDLSIVKKMIDELKAVDTGKHEIIIKWQLFEEAGDNIPLTYECFDYAYQYGINSGYRITSSVFDKKSLFFLLTYLNYTFIPLPFIKFSNRRDLDWLIGEVPRKIPIYVSVSSMPEGETLLYGSPGYINQNRDIALFCVSQYPASINEYERRFSRGSRKHGISDHTVGLELFKKYHPRIWEKHYKLSDSTGLDAGLFAITPEELREIL
jgi:sialic acid synthase SpsE